MSASVWILKQGFLLEEVSGIVGHGWTKWASLTWLGIGARLQHQGEILTWALSIRKFWRWRGGALPSEMVNLDFTK